MGRANYWNVAHIKYTLVNGQYPTEVWCNESAIATDFYRIIKFSYEYYGFHMITHHSTNAVCSKEIFRYTNNSTFLVIACCLHLSVPQSNSVPSYGSHSEITSHSCFRKWIKMQ
jgi:hypothetical protein